MVLTAFMLFSGLASALGTVADVSIYDRAEKRTLPVYHHQGRYFVVGKPGNEYGIRVRNRSGSEILAVLSVDGVNAVSGETASWEQTGYVLGSRRSYNVMGWRKSMERIAAFYFTEHANSYAARIGRPGNVGVIGVAVFRKKSDPEARTPHAQLQRDRHEEAEPQSRAEAAADAAGAPATEGLAGSRLRPAPAQPEKKLGTGHGRSEVSHVTHTDFERATATPAEVIAIYYDSYQNLVAQGVIRAPFLALPAPFSQQFVPDPR
jgi:hypothetical protein